MKRFTENILSSLSIHMLLPIVFFFSVLLLVVQTFVFTVPQAVAMEQQRSKESLHNSQTRLQNTLNTLLQNRQYDAIDEELKLLHAENQNVGFVALFGEEGALLKLSKESFRDHAMRVMEKLNLDTRNRLPRIYATDTYEFHAISPLHLPASNGNGYQSGWLFIQYDYAQNIEHLKAAIYPTFFISLGTWLLFFLVISYIISRFMLKKLALLKEASKNIELGLYGKALPVEGLREIRAITDAFNRMSKKIANDIYTQSTYADLLRHHEAQLTRSQHIAKVGSMTWNPRTEEMECSDEVYNILELSRNCETGWPMLLELFLYEAERNTLVNYIANASRTRRPCALECTIMTPSGKHKVLHLQCEVQHELLKDSELFVALQDITESKEIEMALRREKETAQDYLDIVGVMILVLDVNRNILMINRKGCEIIGYPFEEVIGRNWIENFLPERFRKTVTKVGDTLLDKERTAIRYFENPVLTKSGEERLIAWRYTTLFDDEGRPSGILTSGEDITEIRNAQKQLEQSELFYRSIFDSVFEAVFVLEKGTIIDCNDNTAKLFNKDKSELIGMPLEKLQTHVHCQDDNNFGRVHEQVRHGKTLQTQCVIHLEGSKEYKIAAVTLSPFGDEFDKTVVTARDITRQLEQDRLLKLHTRQAQMGEMIAMIAHQWRQPLTVINAITAQVNVEQLMKETPDDALIDKLGQIERQVNYLSQTITDFRDFFRPDKPIEETTSKHLITKALDLLEHALHSDNITVTTEVVDDAIIKTYRNEVIQVLLTLLKNAQDAFNEGTRTERSIRLTADTEGAYALIRIEDTAGGIPPEVMDDIFLPYFSTKDAKHGTGLGLYMSKTVIEEHCRGTLTAENSEEGARFTIRLPLNKENR